MYLYEGRGNGKSAMTTVTKMNMLGIPMTLEDYWRILGSEDPYEEINKLFQRKER